uniref:amino acid ABC transporter ATP-binding protein n=1 Tax=Aestuariimicrobium ganziense TaxID=2773677 RepID=UPI001A9AFABC
MVEFRAVCKSFGEVVVLDHVTTTVRRGEVVAVLGPSGSGKSTLCRLVNGLETVDSGELLVDGQPLPRDTRGLAELRSRVGMVFQSWNLFSGRTALDNLTLGLVKVRKLGTEDAERRAREVLARVGLADQAGRLPRELSGGQQQRVAIARALAMEPELLLMDEPTSALDPEMVAEVLEVMEGLAAQGMTMIVVTHELGFARRAASRVLFLDRGRVVDDTDPTTFFSAAASDRARAFVEKASMGDLGGA